MSGLLADLVVLAALTTMGGGWYAFPFRPFHPFRNGGKR